LVIRAGRRSGEHDFIRFCRGMRDVRAGGALRPGDVHLVFHTYRGILIYWRQTRYDMVLPAADAKIVLGRMYRHNLTHGLLCAGGVFVPILTTLEYYKQRKKFAEAARRGFPVELK
jgi:hypothetical protein